MKLMSKLLLIMYLTVSLNGLAYAAGSLNGGISIISLYSVAPDLNIPSDFPVKQLVEGLSVEKNLNDFLQNIPRMQGYDWSNVKQENSKLFAVLCDT